MDYSEHWETVNTWLLKGIDQELILKMTFRAMNFNDILSSSTSFPSKIANPGVLSFNQIQTLKCLQLQKHLALLKEHSGNRIYPPSSLTSRMKQVNWHQRCERVRAWCRSRCRLWVPGARFLCILQMWIPLRGAPIGSRYRILCALRNGPLCPQPFLSPWMTKPPMICLFISTLNT